MTEKQRPDSQGGFWSGVEKSTRWSGSEEGNEAEGFGLSRWGCGLGCGGVASPGYETAF